MTSFSRLVPALLAWAAFGMLHAGAAPTDPAIFDLRLPFGPAQATPSWLGHPVATAGTFATLDLPIAPPDPADSLLITVTYQETTGGFLRISWQGQTGSPASPDELPGPGEAGTSAVLCDNFYEGIGMANQRRLLVSADTMRQGGVLHFQASASSLGVSRLRFEWLAPSAGLTSSAITDTLVTAADGRTQPASELAGLPPGAADPAWHGRIVTVPITDVPLRVEQGVDFSIQSQGIPVLARLSLKEAGLPWGQHLVLWINNQRAGVALPAVPDLGDGGYPEGGAGTVPFVGWREATFFVPPTSLLAGSNTLQISAEPDILPDMPLDPSANPDPLALKNVVLQLGYPDTSTAATTTPATTTPAPAQISSAPSSPPAATTSPPSSTGTPPDVADLSLPGALLTLPSDSSSPAEKTVP